MHEFAIRAVAACIYWWKKSIPLWARAKTTKKNQRRRGLWFDWSHRCVSVTNATVSNRQIERGYRRPNQYGPHKNRPQSILIRFNHMNTRHRQKDPVSFFFGCCRGNSGCVANEVRFFFAFHHKIQQSMHIASSLMHSMVTLIPPKSISKSINTIWDKHVRMACS